MRTVTLLFSLTLLVLGSSTNLSLAQAPPAAGRSLAVVLRAAGDHAEEAAHIGAAVAEALAKDAWRIADEAAVAALPPTAAQPAEIGAALGVRFVLAGVMDGGPDIFKIALQLVDTGTGATLWSGNFYPEEDEIETIPDEIVTVVAGRLKDVALP